LVAGGIVFRLVTPNHPGEPSLDDPSLSIQFRKEYVCAEAPGFTTDRAKAHVYPTHLVASIEAQAMGPRFHAASVSSAEEELPERLKPVHAPVLKVLPPVPAYPSKTKQRKPRSTPLPTAVSDRRSWVNEVYG
jgi:hypothetical protein